MGWGRGWQKELTVAKITENEETTYSDIEREVLASFSDQESWLSVKVHVWNAFYE